MEGLLCGMRLDEDGIGKNIASTGLESLSD